MASAFVVAASAQNVTWTGNVSTSWFTGTNWSTTTVPSNVHAAIAVTGNVTTGGASSNINLTGLDLSNPGTQLLFDFTSNGYGLILGTGTSNWSAGTVEVRNSFGVDGNGAANTSLNVSSGVQLLYTTNVLTRYLENLTVANFGTIDVSTGTLSVSNANVTNRSGGLINADSGQVAFYSGTTLNNLGSLQATGASGKLFFYNALTSANLGAINLVSGGQAYLGGTLDNSSTMLAAPNGGSLQLYGGTIDNGSLSQGAVAFTTSGGTLNGVTLLDDLTLGPSQRVTFTGGSSFTGGNATLGTSSTLYWNQAGTLAGKSITFGTASNIYVTGANSTLTLDSATRGTGQIQIYSDGSAGTAITNQGKLNHSASGTGYLYAPTFANSGDITNSAASTSLFIGSTTTGYNTSNTGNITVNASGAVIYLDGNFDNTGGSLNATNGTIYFRGSNTAAHIDAGTTNIGTGSHVYLAGTVANSGTFSAPASGMYELYGGTITGGTIAPSALTFTNGGGYLDGTTLSDDLSLPSGASVRFIRNAAFSGGNVTLGTSASVYWQQTGTLAGKTITFGNGSYFDVAGANATLTLGNTTTATGDIQMFSDGSAGTAITNQGALTQTSSGNGYLYALSFANSGTITNSSPNSSLFIGSATSGYNTTNTGTITVNATGANIYLDGNFDNTGGTLNATNGTVYFRGSNTAAHINGGTTTIGTGSHVYLAGTVANSGTFAAPNSGIYELNGGTITGGAIAPSALGFTSGGGYLDGAVLNDNLSLPTSAYVRFIDNAAFTGGSLTLGTSAGLYWQQAGTLANKAITMGSGSYVYVNGTNDTLTLGNTTTATGDLQIYADGSAGTAITNQGTLTHTSASTGSIYASTLVNTGVITNASPNSYLFIGSTSNGYNTTNTGNITVNATGAYVYLEGNVDNTGGVLNAVNGAVVFQGSNTAAHLNGGTTNIGTNGHVYLDGTIANAGTFTAPASGIYELYGGTITGGSIAPGALAFTSSGGNLDGTTLNDNLSLPNSTYVRLTNNAAFSGGNLTLGSSAGVYWQQAGTLANKTITLGSGSFVYVNGINDTLTLGNTTTATGDLQLYTDGSAGTAITNQGTLTHTSSSTGSMYASTLVNSGVITNASPNSYLFIGSTSNGYNTTNTGNITVNATGAFVYLEGNVDNTGGVLNAANGAIVFQGTNTAAHINGGTTNIGASGHVYLNGTIANAGTFTTPASGIYELYGGTITGGTIAPNALSFTGSGGYLDGTNLNDNLSLPASSYVRFINNASFSGNVTLGASAGVYWQQAGTLAGKSLTLGNGSFWYVAGSNNTLTLDHASSASGDLQFYTDGSAGTAITNQGTLTHTSSSTGSIYAPTLVNSGVITNASPNSYLFIGSTSSGYNTTNTGNITVNATGAYVYLDGNIDNTGGTLNATNGAFVLRGNNVTAHLNGGTTSIASSGHVYLDGTLDNTGATLAAPLGNPYELNGGTINNGTIAASALTFTSGFGTLNHVAVLGNVTFPASSHAYFTGNTTLATSGASLTFNAGAGIYWQQAGTLVDNSLAFNPGSYLYVTGGNDTLTLDSNTTATGDVQIYSDGNTGTAITNEGSISHTNGSGYLYAMSFTNAGNITVTGGTMYLGVNWTGATLANSTGATIRLNGGNVYLQQPAVTPLVNNGTIDIQNGTFYTNNRLTNGTGIISGAGSINGNLIVSGGSIAPGNGGIGTLTITSGTLTVAAPAIFYVDLGGNSSDQIQFTYPTANVNIGSGLLTLSLNLLSAPTATTYNLITIGTTSSFAISGSFAGLPNTGNTITANFGGNPYSFTLNYQPSAISLSLVPIPEPSTYALIAAGGALLFLVRRRRHPASKV